MKLRVTKDNVEILKKMKWRYEWIGKYKWETINDLIDILIEQEKRINKLEYQAVKSEPNDERELEANKHNESINFAKELITQLSLMPRLNLRPSPDNEQRIGYLNYLIERTEQTQELTDEIYQHLEDKESLEKRNKRYRETAKTLSGYLGTEGLDKETRLNDAVRMLKKLLEDT